MFAAMSLKSIIYTSSRTSNLPSWVVQVLKRTAPSRLFVLEGPKQSVIAATAMHQARRRHSFAATVWNCNSCFCRSNVARMGLVDGMQCFGRQQTVTRSCLFIGQSNRRTWTFDHLLVCNLIADVRVESRLPCSGVPDGCPRFVNRRSYVSRCAESTERLPKRTLVFLAIAAFLLALVKKSVFETGNTNNSMKRPLDKLFRNKWKQRAKPLEV